MPHVEVLDLDDAGSVGVHIDAEGVVLRDLVVAPGWRVLTQHPTPGLLRRRARPAPAAVVVLVDDAGTSEREVEVGHLGDGRWEQAVRRQWPWDGRPVRTPGGTVEPREEEGRPRLVSIDPVPGWEVRSREQQEDDVVVVLAGHDEEWEVVLLVGHDDVLLAETDHRRQLGHVG